MGTSREQLKIWFEEGETKKARYMIVVCDTYDYEDFPVYCFSDEEVLRKYKEYDGPNMAKVMEVYDISLGWKAQESGLQMRLPEKPKFEAGSDGCDCGHRH